MIGVRVIAMDTLQHCLHAHVSQQHEALGLVPGQHLRHFDLRRVHQFSHRGKRPAVFLLWRCIHDDAAAVWGVDPEIAPKAGVS